MTAGGVGSRPQALLRLLFQLLPLDFLERHLFDDFFLPLLISVSHTPALIPIAWAVILRAVAEDNLLNLLKELRGQRFDVSL